MPREWVPTSVELDEAAEQIETCPTTDSPFAPRLAFPLAIRYSPRPAPARRCRTGPRLLPRVPAPPAAAARRRLSEAPRWKPPLDRGPGPTLGLLGTDRRARPALYEAAWQLEARWAPHPRRLAVAAGTDAYGGTIQEVHGRDRTVVRVSPPARQPRQSSAATSVLPVLRQQAQRLVRDVLEVGPTSRGQFGTGAIVHWPGEYSIDDGTALNGSWFGSLRTMSMKISRAH